MAAEGGGDVRPPHVVDDDRAGLEAAGQLVGAVYVACPQIGLEAINLMSFLTRLVEDDHRLTHMAVLFAHMRKPVGPLPAEDRALCRQLLIVRREMRGRPDQYS